ncbi:MULTISPECIES: FAD-dependent oxidoreductase [Streptomyces]|uniref:FAD-dependent oxidoreductase n=1 Tax=Streptomyces TaxID=1883 RepID=UPI0016783B16|nr:MULTISPECIES: FAD-binding protein [Streptomyces]MBK3525534.1 FAD-binding protein [Streptomyces sp. MBT70]GGR92584.1 FAD-linked oxidase [Streptomyces eurythermus]
MAELTRRRFTLAGLGAAATGVVVGGEGTPARAAAADATDGTAQSSFGPVTVKSTDRRYQDLLVRGYNRRFTGNPDYVRLVGSTAQVVQAVNEAVAAGKRVTVRGGGHCLEDFVDDPDVKVVIDLSEMRSVSFDSAMNAFVIQGGAILSQVYRTLDLGWGVTIPGGSCPPVGVGGHITGGGYGVLSRQYGLVADNLVAVEVVVVDSSGTAKAVIATKSASDPNRDLWWACAGGGGGNFGIVTRFWLRSPGATGTDPTTLLPPTPGGIMINTLYWDWSQLDQTAFTRIATNFGTWHEQNSAPGAAANQLWASLIAVRQGKGGVVVRSQVDPTVAGNQQLLTSFAAAMTQNVTPAPSNTTTGTLPWLYTTTTSAGEVGDVFGIPSLQLRSKTKGAFHKKGFTSTQLGVIYQYMTNSAYSYSGGLMGLFSFGGQVNALSTTANAVPHRDSVMLASFSNYWADATADDQQLQWIRQLYRDVYTSTGGVPVPNTVTDGNYVNWPDPDLADPLWNTSGVPWSTIYYKGNYAKLQQIKATWDPRNIFHHNLSVSSS